MEGGRVEPSGFILPEARPMAMAIGVGGAAVQGGQRRQAPLNQYSTIRALVLYYCRSCPLPPFFLKKIHPLSFFFIL
jgi:hypothetical protein